MLKAVSGQDDVFKSKAGGSIACNGKVLLRQLVRLENSWRHYGDVLGIVRFEEDSLVIPNYFGRDFRIPLRAVGVAPPSAFLKYYPFDVKGDVVLDIGAYLGDTPLMWLYKGARSVIAVEPVPLHFQYLEKNVAGLPVTSLNVSLAVQLPKISNHDGSIKYGLLDKTIGDSLDVPVMQLTELVENTSRRLSNLIVRDENITF
jgi:FkbM family methyltransferase